VPTAEKVCVAPAMLIHYIDAHGYAPAPGAADEFQRAVLECPPMRSTEYLSLIPRRGLKKQS